jgi:1-deoxy-D-xylulose-5-phosphate synthase
VKVKRLGVPDRFIVHGTQEKLRHLCGIDEESIFHAALRMIQEEKGRKNVTHSAS